MDRINEQSEDIKQTMLDEFRSKMQSGTGLSDSDKEALVQEMTDRLDRMSSLLKNEQSAQSKRLDDLLAARRKKKEELSKKFNEVQ